MYFSGKIDSAAQSLHQRQRNSLGSDYLSHSTSRMLMRVKAVYLYIREKGTVSTQEIAEEFGTTDRTIQRDLSILTHNGLVKSPVRGKWKATAKPVKISS